MTLRAHGKCKKDGKWIPCEEAEESEGPKELVCNYCQPFWVELEAMQLAADMSAATIEEAHDASVAA